MYDDYGGDIDDSNDIGDHDDEGGDVKDHDEDCGLDEVGEDFIQLFSFLPSFLKLFCLGNCP